MTNDPYGQYDPPTDHQPPYPQAPYPPQGQQYPHSPPYQPGPQYPSQPAPGRYPPVPQYPPGPYGQPGPEDPAAPYGGGQYGGGQYGGPPYGGGGYGPGAGWPPPAAPPPRRRTGLIVGIVAGALALVLCAGAGAFVVIRTVASSPEGGDGTDPAANPTAAAPGGDPFAGTPAEQFAQGADGIQPPEAEAVGDFTAEQVADTLARVQEALIASRMDERMLLEHDPEPFLELMSEDDQGPLRESFDSASFAYFASQVADGAELVVPTPRVDGEVSYEATTDDQGFRVIEVVTSFVWAYAFEVPADHPELDGVVVVRDELVWQVAHQEDVRESSLGLWLWDGEAYAWGIDCDAFDQGLLSPQTEPQAGAGGPDDDGQVFDPGSPLDIPDTC